jgi:hypothetical protein
MTALMLSLSLTACDPGEPAQDDSSEADTDTDTDSDTDTDTDTDAFVFEDASTFSRVDRMGMPAINTAVVSSKDDYNAADPEDDVALVFALEIITNLAGLHGALDDDLAAAGLTPCTVVGDGSGTCVAQAAPLMIPDTLYLDTSGTSGFPNGRLLEDPVVDVTLAVILLDLSVLGADTLVGLNPTANDVAFSETFPYLAEPH